MFSFLRSRRRRLFEAEVEQIVGWLIVRHGDGALAEAERKAAEHAGRHPGRERIYRAVAEKLRKRGRT